MIRRSFLLFLVSLGFFACNDNKAEEMPPAPPPPPKYYFYPKANVYFDTVNKDYLFLGGDGVTWTTGKEIPAAMQSMMDKMVLLDTFSQPVWRDNENHRLVYSAVLYASPTDTVEKKKPVAKQTGNQKAQDHGEPKKEKKGLGKFLDKLFGKKKKEKEKN